MSFFFPVAQFIIYEFDGISVYFRTMVSVTKRIMLELVQMMRSNYFS